MKTKPFTSSVILALGGIILMLLGMYFVFIRPPLLPEDLRLMGTTYATIQVAVPGLLVWLHRIFWVMGGFMFTAGFLTAYLAVTAFQQRARGVRFLVVLTGLTSIAFMAIVNFLINSDFKWLLLAFNLPWIAALFVSFLEKGWLSHRK